MNPIHIYRTILSTAGEQAPVLKRCLRDSVIAASLQGASFALLVPICLALGAGNNRAAVLWLLALTALLILSSIFRWRAQDYDYHGNCARADDTMRRHLGEHLRRIPLQILYRQRSGELNALLAGTIDETYNHTLIVSNMLIAAVFTPLATALITLIWDWRLGLIRLIMRYADPQQGRVLIGGSDIRALTQQDLMQQISVVFQDVYLFDDTIGNNIRLGKADATDAEIEAAARAARCHDFIMTLPEGYQTAVGERGATLSGGERQRITIARAILQNRRC